MKEITLYVAEDGTKFNSEEECRTYERNLLAVNAILFNNRKEQITLSQLSEARYIILNNVASLDIIDKLLYKEDEPCISYYILSDIDELVFALEFSPQLIYRNGSDWHWWNAEMARLEDIAGELNYEY